MTGSPLRPRMRRIPRREALGRFGLREGRPTAAIVGGSQGAEVLNRGALEGLDGAAGCLQVIHVAGAGRGEALQAAYGARGATAVVLDFVDDMEALYSAADLVVCRAGAMTIAELAALGVPAVLVPIARSPGDHQRRNARAAALCGGAIVMEEAECLAGGLAPIFRKLARRDPTFDSMRRNIVTLGRPEAARAILTDLREVLRR